MMHVITYVGIQTKRYYYYINIKTEHEPGNQWDYRQQIDLKVA